MSSSDLDCLNQALASVHSAFHQDLAVEPCFSSENVSNASPMPSNISSRLLPLYVLHSAPTHSKKQSYPSEPGNNTHFSVGCGLTSCMVKSSIAWSDVPLPLALTVRYGITLRK